LLPAVACASLASVIRSNAEPVTLRKLDQFHPSMGSYEGKRMHQLKVGDIFCFTDDRSEHWEVTEAPKMIKGVWGVEAIPFVKS
jgi:hypothetical protein